MRTHLLQRSQEVGIPVDQAFAFYGHSLNLEPMTPPWLLRGITSANIMHVDNSIAFADRMPYATGVDGVYAGAAGCHPAGSVIGAAGHNAAVQILADLG